MITVTMNRTSVFPSEESGEIAVSREVLFLHHSVAVSVPFTMLNKLAVLPFGAGLSWKSAACFNIAAVLFTGVRGGDNFVLSVPTAGERDLD